MRTAPRVLPGIEAGRGIAAIIVILYHVSRHIDAVYGTPILRDVFQFGHSGVDFFFVISGFIILYVHYDDVGNPRRLSRYVSRRFIRLFPTYWIALGLTLAGNLLGHQSLPSVRHLTWNAFLLPSDSAMIVDVAWTLRFEVLFYTLFSILILNRRIGIIALAAWFATSAYCNLFGVRIDVLTGQFQAAFVLEFLVGMAASHFARNHEIPAGRVIFGLGVALFAVAALCEDFQLLNGYSELGRLAYGLPSGLIVLGIAAQPEGVSIPDFLRMAGGASYSIYLFQFLVIGTAWQAMRRFGIADSIPPLAQFGMLAVAAIGGGAVISRVIEQPLIRALRTKGGFFTRTNIAT